MRPSEVKLKESTWSIKGFDLGWFLGVLNTCPSISFISLKWGCDSKPLSKDRRGRLNLRQFPAIFSSSKVCMLTTKNLMEGPLGLLPIHMKRSFCFLYSKYMMLLQLLSKQMSSTVSAANLRSIFCSLLVLGMSPIMSSTKCLNRPAMPLEIRMRVLWRFFHSLDCGSGSLNARNSSSC